MSSFKRIPKTLIKISEEKVFANDQFVEEAGVFKESIEEGIAKELYLKKAEQESLILEEVEQQKQTLLQQAYEQGREMALREAIEIVRKENEEMLRQTVELYKQANQHLKQILAESEEKRDFFLHEKGEEVIELALSMAQEIIKKQILIDKETVEGMYRNALSRVRYETKKVFVRVHPDVEKILLESSFQSNRIEFLCDLSLGIGDFLIETDWEIHDASLKSQLEQMKNFIGGVLNDQRLQDKRGN